MGFVILGVLAVAAIGVLAYDQLKPAASTEMEQVETVEANQPSTAEQNMGADAPEMAADSKYQDGEYTVMGEYTSPGGPEEIEVTVQLENGVIVDSEVVPQATAPISVKMQNDFESGYEEQVIGKSLDEVQVSKVAGSSLTPKGFNDALEKIKQEARA